MSLLEKTALPYQAPYFSQIKSEDFSPALLEAMALQQQAITAIVQQTAPPNFDNTVLALEKSGEALLRVANLFFALAGADTNEVLQQTEKEILPLLAANEDSIYLNDKLFERIEVLYQQRASLSLDSESLKLLEHYYDLFYLRGANLSPEKKEALKEINNRLASLENDFNYNTLQARHQAALSIEKEEDLVGLSPEEQKILLQEDGSWKIALTNTTQQPLLSQLEKEETRVRLFQQSWNRASQGAFSTENIVLEIIALRQKKATLLGYDNYAQWSLQKSVAKTPQTVMNFFERLLKPTFEKVAKEVACLKDFSGQDQIAPHNWDYYAEKVRKAQYDLDENQLKPYFELFNVLEKGVFHAATELYGITFKRRMDLPIYHPDVVVYELFEADGSPLGLYYGDFYTRESKRGGAWMSELVTPSKLFGQKPVIYNVCNYTPPTEQLPCLLSFSEVETLFHEFGHALHAFFADQQYATLAGTAVARDFVEFPSQFNEYWALHPEVLPHYARHYLSQEVITSSLIEKLKASREFNRGYAFCEVLASAYLDMQWHTLPALAQVTEVAAFENEAVKRFPKEVPVRYRSFYFSHIFGGGYAAGYYAYQYSEILAEDTYHWFESHGGLTRQNGDRFRSLILSRGNTMDYQEMMKLMIND
ncbi:dipeptidyl carboxypeptidase II [Capnocytophaga gingivalis]|uniref:Dipeptidyl carboxypeptidase n=1 Tax=Capnocytophaga gingivalis TaxID=1017 RepID=A0A250FL40_9FLAO|nr:M3 family metallopeptidase [Capnocytophaga gingivalis]ATA85761.1 dipeptidyl carboxypeptidase II [Capnocytophaga gingivalis]